MANELIIANGIIGASVAFGGWVLRNTVTKANDASSGVKELHRRLIRVEDTIEELKEMRSDIAELRNESKNIKESQQRVEAYILRN